MLTRGAGVGLREVLGRLFSERMWGGVFRPGWWVNGAGFDRAATQGGPYEGAFLGGASTVTG